MEKREKIRGVLQRFRRLSGGREGGIGEKKESSQQARGGDLGSVKGRVEFSGTGGGGKGESKKKTQMSILWGGRKKVRDLVVSAAVFVGGRMSGKIPEI